MNQTAYQTPIPTPILELADACLRLEFPQPGKLVLAGDAGQLLAKVLGSVARGDSVALQIRNTELPAGTGSPRVSPPIQLIGRYEFESAGGIELSAVTSNSETLKSQAASSFSIDRIQREGFPPYSASIPNYNPLLTVWDRAVDALPREPIACLALLAGKHLRVSFSFGGSPGTVEGVLASERSASGGLVFEGEKRQTLPNPEREKIVFNSILVLNQRAPWDGTEGIELSVEAVPVIRTSFSEGLLVNVQPFFGPAFRGSFAGIDDRFLPILSVKVPLTVAGQPSFAFRSILLREVRSIATFLPGAGTDPIVVRTAWKASATS